MSCETQESDENNSSDENQGSLIYSEYHLKKEVFHIQKFWEVMQII